MCIIVKDTVVAIIEDIIISATVTATIAETEIMLTPKTILVTEAEGLATALSRARFRGSIRGPIQGCGADLQEAQNYQFRLDGILKKCHKVKSVQ